MQDFKFTTNQIDRVLEAKTVHFPGSFQQETSSGKHLRFVLKGSSYAISKSSRRNSSKNRDTLVSNYEVSLIDGTLLGYLSLSKVIAHDKVVQTSFCIMNRYSQTLFKSTTSGLLVSSYSIADASAMQMAAEILASISE